MWKAAAASFCFYSIPWCVSMSARGGAATSECRHAQPRSTGVHRMSLSTYEIHIIGSKVWWDNLFPSWGSPPCPKENVFVLWTMSFSPLTVKSSWEKGILNLRPLRLQQHPEVLVSVSSCAPSSVSTFSDHQQNCLEWEDDQKIKEFAAKQD